MKTPSRSKKTRASSRRPSSEVDRSAKTADERDRRFVIALARGLMVLQACGSAKGALTISEIAKQIRLPQPTVWRLCYTMLKLGFLDREDDDRVRPGLPLLSLGYGVLAQLPLAKLARPGMEEIARRFPGAVSLGVRQDFEMLYIERIQGGSIVFSGLRTGSKVSLIASAMGWGYLAGLPETERDALLASARQHMPEEYSRVVAPMQAAIKQFQRKGWIVNAGILHPEINAVAVPIGTSGATPKACLSFGGSRSIFPVAVLEGEVGPQLRDLARALSFG